MKISAIALSLLAAVEARIVTIHSIVTGEPTTIFVTGDPNVFTKNQTDWVSTTIFQAKTLVTTVPTGVIESTSVSPKSNPVTQHSTYTTTALTTSINPSTYTEPFSIVSTSKKYADISYGNINAAMPSSMRKPFTVVSTSKPDANGTYGNFSSSLSTQSGDSLSSVDAVSQSKSTSSAASSRVSSSLSVSSGSPSSTGSLDISSQESMSSSAPSSSISHSASAGLFSSSAAVETPVSTVYAGPIFDPISTHEPPSMFKREAIPLKMPPGHDNSQIVQTNKFYGNLLLADQSETVFAQPYELFYSTDPSYYGVAVSYVNKTQRVFGPDASKNPVQFYINPLKIKTLVFSAKEFTKSNLEKPKVTAMGPFSANMSVSAQGASGQLTIPMSLGMGFVTAIYDGFTPRLFSQIGIFKITKSKNIGNYNSKLQKFVFILMNGIQWNVYVKGPENFGFNAVDSFQVVGNATGSGANAIIVQAAVIEGEELKIDSAAGAYPVGAELEGETNGLATTYRIAYEVCGESNTKTTLLYALPHHVETLTGTIKANIIPNLRTYSTTKGYLTGVLSNTLEMIEDVSDAPSWLTGSTGELSVDALKLLASTVNKELAEDMKGQTNVPSTYTAGKAFDKFAYILLVASEILENDEVTLEGLNSLKAALEPWLRNTQPIPFMYDTLCKGITSSAANMAGGSPLDDYGAPLYNDHHFHYGYYVHAAAVIAKLDLKVGDGTWIEQNKDWVNSLVRDVANPSPEDTYFPVSRMFDFFAGHSWAHGMFASADGKDEESTSEDYNFAYGMKLWGEVIGDDQMAARGSLMISIMKRAMNLYFLYKDDNTIQPSNFIGNRAAGIFFENKIDHVTYFGTNIEYVQGINMLPLTPASVVVRGKDFVQQEWNSLLAPVVGSLNNGWAGILRANQALFDPKSSYDYFASPSFTSSLLDGGASRSWYLAFSGLLGGSA